MLDSVPFGPKAWVCFRRRRYYDTPNAFCLRNHGGPPRCGWRQMVTFDPDDDWMDGPDAARTDIALDPQQRPDYKPTDDKRTTYIDGDPHG